MFKKIQPSKINGTVHAPASKSMMQRAVAAAILTDGRVEILNPSLCNDGLSAIDVAKGLGKKVISEPGKLIFNEWFRYTRPDLNVGESGLGIRMFTPLAALLDKTIRLQGSGTLLNRPVDMMEAPLEALGAKCVTRNGFVPVTICGPLQGGVAEIDGSISSQMLTGLITALPLAPNDSTLHVHKLRSIPYVDMTMQLLKNFGIEVTHENYEIFHIKGNQVYQPANYFIEGDWSGAAFFLVAGAIGGEVKVTGLLRNSAQADIIILDALQRAGAIIGFEKDYCFSRKNQLNAFEFDATHCPDLFPPLAVLAANCKGTTKIIGAERLLYKESNRALALMSEFAKIGISITVDGDVMSINGSEITGGTMDSYNDHRVAMMGACAAINSKKEVIIQNSACVSKSWPTFFGDFGKIRVGG
ncbi:MAG: 3-phosphoshikimate 1-carboxyvinyltransferase [Bacteroidetes bacterium GWF2_38_335]|nr:MAG: 3-phosphoshikimate 1-carboxyvinyltransferase [Bacteroidetes bacterium GWF2_38_335]OFY79314.1 MAG: 3-phosphoshikimate 1-carboxyvinyltransferase [Bacteroidetes bacterium RIFOXYA12_FULL_38_20]HBS85571.1 3-phosphoshikimate 1-carboxyvinyltransferase [Bacteroidales bacterium]